ncbi:MAG: hypothetical protein ABFS19_02515 [Thermodesulfobacteriota bacterium]
MQRTIVAPLAVLFGIIVVLLLASRTSIFTPLIQFIHTGEITVIQAALCIVFSGAGFAACYTCLMLLCSYFVPRMDSGAVRGESQTS